MGELMTAQNASKGASSTQEIYNMIEDNKNLRDNYELNQYNLVHKQRSNHLKKQNILEENLAKRRARVAAMGMSDDGSASAEQKREAYEGYKDIADSCYLYRSIGREVHIVEGNRGNIKVTTPEDFYLLRALLQYRENEQILGLR